MLVTCSTEGGLGNPETRFLSPGGEFLNTRFGSRPVKRPRLSADGFRTEENGVATNMIHDDDTTSTSGDEGLFVIHVRSPTSKQLLHGQRHADGNNNNSSSLLVDDPKHELCSHGLSGNEGDVAGHGFVGKSDTGWEGEGAAMNVYIRKRKRSSDSIPVQEHGFSQSEDVIKHYVRRKQIEKPSQHVEAKEVDVQDEQHVEVKEVDVQDEQHAADISLQVEEGNLNVFQRRAKKNPVSHAEHAIDGVESEGVLKVFRRRSLPDADQVSARAETTESNVNVFQRRSKMTNPVSHAENIARVEKLHVFHRRSVKNQVPEHNLNVFQRRSKMKQVSQAEHHVDVKAKHHGDVEAKNHVDVEGEGKFHVFKRRAKVHPENVGETGGNLHVFQRRSKMNPEKKESDELEKGLVSEKLGYVPADHQPGWLPQGWTLEVREGTAAAKPRDKYYHHNQSGRIFRSKHEVLQFLARSEVMVSDGSGIKIPPPVAVAHATKSSGDGTQLPHDGSPAKSLSDQENRGKLILRLKRKQPDSDGGGKGRPKRPVYEVIHGEKPSSSTSTPTKPSQETTPASPHSLPNIPQQTNPPSDHTPSQEQEPHTAVGIPATSYNTNVFLPDSCHTFINVNAPEAAAEVHKALKASRAIPKLDHTKLFLDLGRRLCLAGVEQRPRR